VHWSKTGMAINFPVMTNISNRTHFCAFKNVEMFVYKILEKAEIPL